MFLSLVTEMILTNKFKNLNGRFENLEAEMTQQYKFRYWWWTLLFCACTEPIVGLGGSIPPPLPLLSQGVSSAFFKILNTNILGKMS